MISRGRILCFEHKVLGPVVQSIVSLTMSLIALFKVLCFCNINSVFYHLKLFGHAYLNTFKIPTFTMRFYVFSVISYLVYICTIFLHAL